MTHLTTPPTPAAEPPAGPAGAKDQAADVAAHAKQEAAGVASSAMDQVSSVASSATDQAKAVASDAAAQAKDVFGDVRQQLRAQADEQSAKVAALVGDIGAQLRTMANAGDGPAKDLVATVADQASGFSQRMRDGGLDRTLDDARRLARNRPGLFLAGAALAGFVAARIARVADTDSLKRAANPSEGSGAGNGQAHSLGSAPDLALEAAPPVRTRPLQADPIAPSSATRQ